MIKFSFNSKNLFFVLLAIYFFPIIISLNLPFAKWDWLNTDTYQMREKIYSFSDIFSNIFFSLFIDTVQFRPVSTLITNLNYLIFEGEFWIWYLIKWLVFFYCIHLIYSIVFILTQNKLPAFLSGLFYGINPMPFVLDVISQDAYLVLFFLLSFRFYLLKDPFLGKDKKNIFIYLLLVCLSILSKETGIGLFISLLVFHFYYDFNRSKKTKLSILFFTTSIFVFIIYILRILQINHPNSKKNFLFDQNIQDLIIYFLKTNRRIFDQILVTSPFGILIFSLIIILFYGLFLILKNRNSRDLGIAFFLILCLVLTNQVISLANICAKYLPTPMVFLTLLIGICSNTFWNKSKLIADKILKFMIIILIMFSPSKIYASWFGMMQTGYENMDILNFLTNKQMNGYKAGFLFGVPEDIPWESIGTIKKFYRVSSKKFYNYYDENDFDINIYRKEIPKNEKLVILTNKTPDQISKGVFQKYGIKDLSYIDNAFYFKRENYGLFEYLLYYFKKFEKLLGVRLKDPITCQPPRPSTYGFNFINPNHKDRFPYFVMAGPHYIYEINPEVSKKFSIIELKSLRRYGSITR